MASEPDTDWQKKHGLGYSQLAAAAAATEQAIPVPVFDTAEIRINQRETIRVLTEENSRLLCEQGLLLKANAELVEQLKRLQDKLAAVSTPPAPETPAVGLTKGQAT